MLKQSTLKFILQCMKECENNWGKGWTKPMSNQALRVKQELDDYYKEQYKKSILKK